MCHILLICVVMLLCSSCAYRREVLAFEKACGAKAPVAEMIAVRSDTPVVLDGCLNEDVWKNAPVYSFRRPLRVPVLPVDSKFTMDWKEFQGGTIRLAYTDDTLYIAAVMEDTDIVQYNQKNQQRHYNTGDLLEIMIKSDKAPGFWECYGTPSGHRTTMHHIARGYCHDLLADFRDDFKIGVQLNGTLNNYNDSDKGWIIEAAIPFTMLQDLNGIKVDNEGAWRLFIARYNYDYNQSYRQLSCFPLMPETRFEAYEYFARLLFK